MVSAFEPVLESNGVCLARRDRILTSVALVPPDQLLNCVGIHLARQTRHLIIAMRILAVAGSACGHILVRDTFIVNRFAS